MGIGHDFWSRLIGWPGRASIGPALAIAAGVTACGGGGGAAISATSSARPALSPPNTGGPVTLQREYERVVASHPLGRIAEPQEVADAIVWLATEKSSYVTGIALPVDGGYLAA